MNMSKSDKKAATQEVLEPSAQLQEIISNLGSMDVDPIGADRQQGVKFVPESQVLMPSDAAINNTMIASLGDNPKAINLSPAMAKELDHIRQTEDVKVALATKPSTFAMGTTAVNQPAEVRDVPNRLYYTKDANGRMVLADKGPSDNLLLALFGRDLGKCIMQTAAQCGFDQKPLIWISQQLWMEMLQDRPRGWNTAIHPDVIIGPFIPEHDQHGSSPILSRLKTITDGMTVNNLVQRAKYNQVSVLTVIRVIMAEICKEMKTLKV
jgi:hypothetical protein